MGDSRIQVNGWLYMNYSITLYLRRIYKEREELLEQLKDTQKLIKQNKIYEENGIKFNKIYKESLEWYYNFIKTKLDINFELAAEARAKLVIC